MGMVFPLPVGLPLSVYENVAYAPRRAGMRHGQSWTPWWKSASARPCSGTKSRSASTCSARKLSGGQQQRLTLARALSHRPEILCLDEFSIAIDPMTTMKIEDVLLELKERDDHRVGDQPGAAGPPAGRSHGLFQRFAADRSGRDGDDFTHPANRLTERYVNGEFG